MLKDDLLVVSAQTSEKREKLKYHFNVVAGGVVKSNYTFTDSVVRNFEDLKKVDPRFQEVRIMKDQKQLFLHLAVLGYHARMYLKMDEQKTNNTTKWDWECIEGSFKGMKGLINIQEIGRHRTELSFASDYFSEKLPLPKAIVNFGIEIIARQVAEKMRSYIHAQAKIRGYYFNDEG